MSEQGAHCDSRCSALAAGRRPSGFPAACLALLAAGACLSHPPRPLDPDQAAQAFERRSLADPALKDFVARALELPAAPPGPLRWDPRALGAAAVYFQPRIEAAFARARRAAAAVQSAGALPNPTLAISPEYATNPDPGVSPWVAAVQLDWRVETAGKRAHRIDAAQARALSARLALDTEVWNLRREVAVAALGLAAARRQRPLLEAEVAIRRELALGWRRRVDAGTASRADAAPAATALLEASREQAAQGSAEEEALGQLAAAVGMPSRELRELELPLPAEPDPLLGGIDRAAALEQALGRRSDVLGALADYAGAEAELALELARQYPDLHLGPGYQWDQGLQKWSLGLSLELPLLDRNQGPIAEALAAREEAAAAFAGVQAAAIAEIGQALARRDGAAAGRNALAELVREGERNASRAERARSLGAASRLDALAARAEALRARRASEAAEVAWQQALTELGSALQLRPLSEKVLQARLRPGGGGREL